MVLRRISRSQRPVLWANPFPVRGANGAEPADHSQVAAAGDGRTPGAVSRCALVRPGTEFALDKPFCRMMFLEVKAVVRP